MCNGFVYLHRLVFQGNTIKILKNGGISSERIHTEVVKEDEVGLGADYRKRLFKKGLLQ